MQASDVMSSPVYVVSPTENVAHARNLMLKHKMSRIPVMENGRLVGILTKKDIAYRLRQSEPIWRRRPIDMVPVSIVMTSDPITISADTPVQEVARLMINYDISGIPVVDDDGVVGIVTKSDMLRSTAARHLTMKAGEVMSDVLTINRYHSLDHIIDVMSERNDKMVVMNDNGTIAGIITESNLAFFEFINPEIGVPEKDVTILRKETAAGRKMLRQVVQCSAVAEDLMSRPVLTTASDAPLSEAVDLMREHHIASVVVVDGNDLKGIINRDDIIREVAK
jgi:CBS domain-containing protein